ncbi:hypothetical protein VP01_1172g5 [Puccinia sorghi]|uniref:Uncharacterized protein n=1 Tax=Puccinia sorghi TaxID=27349 RepID=A0A0L6VSP6_9BASI|nr:hypothetical protein VP01_1172g5 [Puccinia sorghi]
MKSLETALLQESINCYYSSIFPFNSKTVDKPLNYLLMVPITPKSEPLKKLAIGVLELVPHAAGMMAQIKLHLLQAPTQDNSEYESMKAYNTFLPTKLKAFKDCVFNQDQWTVVASREDTFMDTILDFKLWKTSSQEPDKEIIEIKDINIPAGDSNWAQQSFGSLEKIYTLLNPTNLLSFLSPAAPWHAPLSAQRGACLHALFQKSCQQSYSRIDESQYNLPQA